MEIHGLSAEVSQVQSAEQYRQAVTDDACKLLTNSAKLIGGNTYSPMKRLLGAGLQKSLQ